MKVEEMIKFLQQYNRQYEVKLTTNHGYPEIVIEIVIVDFNGRITKIVQL